MTGLDLQVLKVDWGRGGASNPALWVVVSTNNPPGVSIGTRFDLDMYLGNILP